MRNYEREYANLMNALAEFTFEMSDEDIEEEIRAEGLDPEIEAGRVKQIMLDAVRKFQADKTA
jgi:hypothetical protein